MRRNEETRNAILLFSHFSFPPFDFAPPPNIVQTNAFRPKHHHHMTCFAIAVELNNAL
jgi:hypothetical protein